MHEHAWKWFASFRNRGILTFHKLPRLGGGLIDNNTRLDCATSAQGRQWEGEKCTSGTESKGMMIGISQHSVKDRVNYLAGPMPTANCPCLDHKTTHSEGERIALLHNLLLC